MYEQDKADLKKECPHCEGCGGVLQSCYKCDNTGKDMWRHGDRGPAAPRRGTSDDQVGEMDLFLASKPDEMSPDGKEHVIRTLSRIRDIGQEIHDRGGLAAMQAIFYIMTNFIVGNDRDRAKFTALKRFWRGIGNWEY